MRKFNMSALLLIYCITKKLMAAFLVSYLLNNKVLLFKNTEKDIDHNEKVYFYAF